VFDSLSSHNLKRLFDAGARVTINSDDPAYFGGYIADNYLAAAGALDLTEDDIMSIARYSIEGAFIDERERSVLLAELERHGDRQRTR
jgi:adenosine deaminase